MLGHAAKLARLLFGYSNKLDSMLCLTKSEKGRACGHRRDSDGLDPAQSIV